MNILNTYLPKPEAIRAFAAMQSIAKASKMTVQEMAVFLGYSCPYEWEKAIIAVLEDKSGINPIPVLPLWNGESQLSTED